MEDICYADANTLFLVGGDERIYKSTNGGFFWTEVDSGAAQLSFLGVEFYNSNYGIVTGEDGKILVTTNSGTDWMTSNTGGSGLMRAAHIINDQNAYVVGTPEQVFKTTDGGINWVSDFNGASTIALYEIKFTENLTGLICGSEGKFLKNNDYVVPVELTSFTAAADGNEVLLSWTTQTELNNSGFEIYRLTHGTDWHKITFIPGYGSSTEPKDYFYTDRDVKNGNYFYQLKQIDYNGRYEFSNVISVDVSTPVEYSLEQNSIHLIQYTIKFGYRRG
ncbi:MAG: YCF48-related protein [Ignavibacteriaceae bacterium]|nr:YCF48-related protein [Ignavibacteriaceae bacterium]